MNINIFHDIYEINNFLMYLKHVNFANIFFHFEKEKLMLIENLFLKKHQFLLVTAQSAYIHLNVKFFI